MTRARILFLATIVVVLVVLQFAIRNALCEAMIRGTLKMFPREEQP